MLNQQLPAVTLIWLFPVDAKGYLTSCVSRHFVAQFVNSIQLAQSEKISSTQNGWLMAQQQFSDVLEF